MNDGFCSDSTGVNSAQRQRVARKDSYKLHSAECNEFLRYRLFLHTIQSDPPANAAPARFAATRHAPAFHRSTALRS
jgi:hypothetical protein